MKKICLFFFSGTGMTKYVIERFINEFDKHQIIVDCFRIDNNNMQSIILSEYNAFGIAYPVHAFNAPKIVIDFIKELPKSNGIKIFILHTAGEDNAVNYSASHLLIKKLEIKGYTVFYNRLIEMPSNFVIKYNDERVKQILNKANEIIPFIAKDIIQLKPYSMKKSFISNILAFLGRAEWYGAHIAGKFFYVKSDCIHCGKCVENCPNKNIIKKKQSIKFLWRCGLCMRCIYQCPSNSINVHQPFKFIRFDKWYDSEMFNK